MLFLNVQIRQDFKLITKSEQRLLPVWTVHKSRVLQLASECHATASLVQSIDDDLNEGE